MTEYVVPAAVIGLLGLALQGTIGAIKMARGILAERNGTAPRHGDAQKAIDAKLEALVDIAVFREKLGSIERRVEGIHDSVHDLRDIVQPIVTEMALHKHRISQIEART